MQQHTMERNFLYAVDVNVLLKGLATLMVSPRHIGEKAFIQLNSHITPLSIYGMCVKTFSHS